MRERKWRKKRSMLRWKWKSLSCVNPSRYTGWVRGDRETPQSDSHCFQHLHTARYCLTTMDCEDNHVAERRAERQGEVRERERKKGSGGGGTEEGENDTSECEIRTGWRRPSGDEGEETKDKVESANHAKPVKWHTQKYTCPPPCLKQ